MKSLWLIPLALLLAVAGCKTTRQAPVAAPAAKAVKRPLVVLNLPIPPPPTKFVTNAVSHYEPITNWTHGLTGTNLNIGLIIWTSNSVTIGVTNTFTNRIYSIWQATAPNGSWSQVGSNFLGSNQFTAYTVSISGSHRFYLARQELGLVIFPSYVYTGSGNVPCGGNYAGYANFTKPIPDWGWSPSTTPHTATASRVNDAVEAAGEYGDTDCGVYTVTVPDPTTSPLYRFITYFKSTVPTNPYLVLNGFNQ